VDIQIELGSDLVETLENTIEAMDVARFMRNDDRRRTLERQSAAYFWELIEMNRSVASASGLRLEGE
jgi:hypothetical protein